MRLTLITTCIAIGGAAQTAAADPSTYELDPSHTTIYFTVDHIGYSKTLGIFGEVSGTFVYDMDTQELSDVAVTIKSDSVNTFHEARDGHVKNQDFLHVSEFPDITFAAANGSPSSETSGQVTGDLTLLGQTQPVTLDVTLNKAAEYPFGHKRFVLGLSLESSIKRSEFGMTYGVENGLVGDDVTIRIETEAMRME
ncbi:MAG: YceI family protein [Pseudomonadota bacterium]